MTQAERDYEEGILREAADILEARTLWDISAGEAEVDDVLLQRALARLKSDKDSGF